MPPDDKRGPRAVRDVMVHDGLRYVQQGPPLLLGYLALHPQRVRDVMRLVPEAVNGMHAVARIEDGRLLVTGVQVEGAEDPLRDMVLWHALFPGLRAPLVAWWFTEWLHPGPKRLVIGGFVVEPAEMPPPDPQLRWWIERGHVRSHPDAELDLPYQLTQPPYSLPLVVRVLLVPLFLLVMPFAIVALYLEGRKRPQDEVPWWSALLMPIFAVGIVLKLLMPLTFMRHLEPWFNRLDEGHRQRMQVKDLLNEAFRNELRRPLRR
jgi:hypothetical protein